MERKDEFKRFCMALHLCANYTKSYAGDLLIDLTNAWEQYLGEEKWPVFFIRKSGADLIDRFESILIEKEKPHEFKDCIEYAKKTLGVDFAMEITPYKVIITNVALDEWAEKDLVNRLTDIVKIQDVEVVKA